LAECPLLPGRVDAEIYSMRTGAATERTSHRMLGDARPPVLVVKVDAAGIDSRGGPERRCDVRLMRSAWGMPAVQSRDSDGREVTAVVILRDATPSSVVSCVRAATRGGSISPELLGQLLLLGDEAAADAGEPQLSDRECEVLRMLADGESTRVIAAQLSYSERTVKNIVRDLLIKLNGRTRAHAVALATRQGVI
jgi:DNA-binding NarL/FixJ family response regulator